jgi:hypothetical protein
LDDGGGILANTTYLRGRVEAFVRSALEQEFGQNFESKPLKLITGGKHEFDAVSGDQRIVAAIKTASGKTVTGKGSVGQD